MKPCGCHTRLAAVAAGAAGTATGAAAAGAAGSATTGGGVGAAGSAARGPLPATSPAGALAAFVFCKEHRDWGVGGREGEWAMGRAMLGKGEVKGDPRRVASARR